MIGREREFLPPEPVGEPFRADPADPAPFPAADETPTRIPAPSPGPGPPFGHPPTHSREFQERYGDPTGAGRDPFVPRPAQRPPLPVSADERFAKTARGLGIASIFVFNVVLGPIAMVMGVMAMRRGEQRLGRSAVIFGAIGLTVGILLLVLAALGVIPSVDEMLKDLRRSSSQGG